MNYGPGFVAGLAKMEGERIRGSSFIITRRPVSLEESIGLENEVRLTNIYTTYNLRRIIFIIGIEAFSGYLLAFSALSASVFA